MADKSHDGQSANQGIPSLAVCRAGRWAGGGRSWGVRAVRDFVGAIDKTGINEVRCVHCMYHVSSTLTHLVVMDRVQAS